MALTEDLRLAEPDGLRLGFGCASLLRKGRTVEEGERLIEAALDLGVRYFDTARMYGEGRAEAVLGALSARRRGEMVIASKAGILPSSRALAPRVIRKAVATVHRALPSSQTWVKTPRIAEPAFHVFSPVEFVTSVETSLKELQTDHLDILFLHEAALSDLSDGLLGALEGLKQQGKTRYIGIASEVPDTLAILAGSTYPFDIVQIASRVGANNVPNVRHLTSAPIAIHSTMGVRFQALAHDLTSDPAKAATWSERLGIDLSKPGQLAALFLAHALASNPGGLVLFSSERPDNIARNAYLSKRESTISEETLEALTQLVSMH